MSTPSQPPPGYASDPTLEMLWTTPPAFTGLGQASSSSSAPPLSNSFTVSLSTVQSAEQSMLSAAAAVVGPYNTMEQQVQTVISEGTIYGQQATITEHVTVNRPIATPPVHVADTPLQQSGQQFAAQINPAMTRVLRLIADGMETVGVFIAMLNNSGQIYTTADKNSAIPPPS